MLTLLSANLLYVVTFGKMILVSWDIYPFSHFFKMSLLKFSTWLSSYHSYRCVWQGGVLCLYHMW